MQPFIKSNKLIFSSLFILLTYTSFSQEATISTDSINALITTASDQYDKLNITKSLQTAKIALNHAYKNGDLKQIGRIYNIIGSNYTEFSDYKKAEEVYLKGIEAVKEGGHPDIESWININLANLYHLYFNNNLKALEYYNKALNYAKKENSEYNILIINLNLGIVNVDLKDYKEALKNINEASKYIYNINEPTIFITYHSVYAYYYHELNDYTNAEKHYLKAEMYCESDKSIDFQSMYAMELYDDMARLYATKNNKVKAYDYLLKHLAIRDSVYTLEKTNSAANAVSQIDLDNFKRDIENVEKQNQEQKQVLVYSRVIIFLFLIIGIGLIIFIFYLISSRKQKNEFIDQIAKNNKELEIAKAKAEQVSEIKTQFISKVSHELRTPLYGIIGLAKFLEQDFPILKNNQILHSLNFSANFLMNLINDILQLQKIEANAIKIDKNPFNILNETNYIIENLNVIAHKNKNKIITNFSNLEFKYLENDKIKINQILYNVLSNALKFTKNGIVSVTINQNKISETTVDTEIVIKDTGIGIPKENLEDIFEKFSQFNSNGTDYQGTGLGLSIVKQLVDLLDGKINVQSIVNKGTNFSISFPSTILSEIEVKKEFDLDNLNLKSIKILLVENNEINRFVNQRNFKSHEVPCTIVPSAKEALELLEHATFDVILTDINMPEMDGFQMSKIIRKTNPNIPIIALTAYTKEDIASELESAGINDLVTKPFEFETLLLTIYRSLE